jgi:hypothetical protein
MDPDQKKKLDMSLNALRPMLGQGANLSNVLCLMIDSLIRTVEAGKRPVIPFECRTIDDLVYAEKTKSMMKCAGTPGLLNENHTEKKTTKKS